MITISKQNRDRPILTAQLSSLADGICDRDVCHLIETSSYSYKITLNHLNYSAHFFSVSL